MKKTVLTYAILLILFIPFILSRHASTQHTVSYLSTRFHEVWRTLDSVRIPDHHPDIHISKDSSKILDIGNQEDFNNLNSSLATAIKEGFSNIQINLRHGIYEYEENHILLNGIQSGLNIVIDGNGSELVSKRTKASGKKNPLYVYSLNNTPIDFWSETIQLKDSIVSINDSNIYRLKIPVDADIEPGDLIKVSQWFVSGLYEVDKVDDGYLYFSTDYPFINNRKNWNVNYDLKYGKTMPRFRVFKTTHDEALSQHESACFLRIQNSSFESLKITALNFWGSAQSQKGVISFVKVKSGVTDISRCNFKECKSPCITLTDASNVLIEDCSFTDNYNNCIGTDNQCVNTRIINNCFKNNDRDWYNHFDIRVSGDRFLVADNTIVNSPYGAIRVGDWWRNQNIQTVKGIVENNLIHYTPDFYNDYWKHTLMDSGAIYVNTINDDVHIRYNRIYNIAGMKDYRGIFRDDGTCNSRIYGNVITGIKDSYSIDLRETPKVEENPQYKFGMVNVNNILIYNIVDGDIRFEVRLGENGCIKGPNYLLLHKDRESPKLKIKNIYNQEDDILLDIKHTDIKHTNEGLIVLSRPDKSKLKKNPIYRKITKWIK